jgi:hypothetical protein
MVEIEFGVLAAQCLDRRTASVAQLTSESNGAIRPVLASNGCSQPQKWAEAIPRLRPTQGIFKELY